MDIICPSFQRRMSSKRKPSSNSSIPLSLTNIREISLLQVSVGRSWIICVLNTCTLTGQLNGITSICDGEQNNTGHSVSQFLLVFIKMLILHIKRLYLLLKEFVYGIREINDLIKWIVI